LSNAKVTPVFRLVSPPFQQRRETRGAMAARGPRSTLSSTLGLPGVWWWSGLLRLVA